MSKHRTWAASPSRRDRYCRPPVWAPPPPPPLLRPPLSSGMWPPDNRNSVTPPRTSPCQLSSPGQGWHWKKFFSWKICLKKQNKSLAKPKTRSRKMKLHLLQDESSMVANCVRYHLQAPWFFPGLGLTYIIRKRIWHLTRIQEIFLIF